MEKRKERKELKEHAETNPNGQWSKYAVGKNLLDQVELELDKSRFSAYAPLSDAGMRLS